MKSDTSENVQSAGTVTLPQVITDLSPFLHYAIISFSGPNIIEDKSN